MARQERDREDLMAEATALADRVEMMMPGRSDPVVAGFWRDGRMSVYFGGDPVYHVDSSGRLRKAYAQGKLYRADRSGLAELRRRRSDDESVLLRNELSLAETRAFLETMRSELRDLSDALDAGAAHVIREHPPGADVVDRLKSRLRELVERPPSIAPGIGRR